MDTNDLSPGCILTTYLQDVLWFDHTHMWCSHVIVSDDQFCDVHIWFNRMWCSYGFPYMILIICDLDIHMWCSHVIVSDYQFCDVHMWCSHMIWPYVMLVYDFPYMILIICDLDIHTVCDVHIWFNRMWCSYMIFRIWCSYVIWTYKNVMFTCDCISVSDVYMWSSHVILSDVYFCDVHIWCTHMIWLYVMFVYDFAYMIDYHMWFDGLHVWCSHVIWDDIPFCDVHIWCSHVI